MKSLCCETFSVGFNGFQRSVTRKLDFQTSFGDKLRVINFKRTALRGSLEVGAMIVKGTRRRYGGPKCRCDGAVKTAQWYGDAGTMARCRRYNGTM